MIIKHRYGFGAEEQHIFRFLDKQQVDYRIEGLAAVVDMFEDDEKFDLVHEYMTHHKALDISEAVFEDEEIENAQWLAVRSTWWSQYPQPQRDLQYRVTTYDGTNYCDGNKPEYFCGKGLIQKACFKINREPNWSSRGFMMLNWVGDELFVSSRTEMVLMESELTGFHFLDVTDKTGKKLGKIKQLFIENYLPVGISDDSLKQKLVCPQCHFTKYLLKNGPIRFRKEIFRNLSYDIMKTSEKFGEIECDSLILINHKFFQVVKQAKLDRGLVFVPVELV